MNKRIVDFIKGLNEKDLKYMYERYSDFAFTFYINNDLDKCERAINITNLIEETLRDKGIWNKK
ncbi:MAG: hypothetical protein ACI31M_04470 [Bacilli bacterium]